MTARQRAALALAKRIALGIDGVTGVDFGFVYRRRKRTRARAIRFHVARKQPLRALAAEQRLPRAIDGVPVDVVEARYGPHVRATGASAGGVSGAADGSPPVDPRGRVDPLRPGASIGPISGGHTGTLGAFVVDRDDGALGLLSNWHVLASGARPGDAIAQPGPDDLGPKPPTRVATLLRAADLGHGVDAAVAAVTTDARIALEPLGLPRAPGPPVAARAGMRLRKSGRATGVTHAIVDGEEGSFVIDYSAFGDRLRWMDGLRLVPDPAAPTDEISMSGDSGALWLDVDTHAAVALLFGGEDEVGPTAEYALAHPIGVVLDRLRVDLKI